MSRLSQTLLFVLLSILGIGFSGCRFFSSDTVYSGKYFQGEVIIRAERDFPVGMIKFSDLYTEDEYLETPRRAILYKFSEDQLFDLSETVFYKIVVRDGIQFAEDVKTTVPTDLATKSETYKVLQEVSINLHNSDEHREGPQHKVWHVKPNQNYNIGIVQRIELTDPNTNTDQAKCIKVEFALQTNRDYYLYPSDEDLNGCTASRHVYILSTTHNHNH